MTGAENNGRINVLFLMIQMEMGGAERLVHNLALKLDRDRFNPSVAWFFGDRILKDFKDLGVPLYHVPKVKRFDFSAMRALSAIIRDNNIHVVNAHHFMSMVYAFYGCKIRNHAKLVYTEHSEWEVEGIPWKWVKIGGYLLNKSDAAIGVNEKVAEAIQRKFKMASSKVLAFNNGVDITVFSKNNNDISALRAGLGINDKDKVIGIVANFKRIKNHIFLLKAFTELLKSRKDVKLLLIGQGFKNDADNTEQELRDFVEEKGIGGNVMFLGYRSDIPELLSLMDIYCLTSFKEGLPISLLEAMVSGLPAVGADVEGIRGVIASGKNGLIVSLEDINGLKEALYTLLLDDSLRKRMGLEARRIATENYSLKACIDKYQDLFTSVYGLPRNTYPYT